MKIILGVVVGIALGVVSGLVSNFIAPKVERRQRFVWSVFIGLVALAIILAAIPDPAQKPTGLESIIATLTALDEQRRSIESTASALATQQTAGAEQSGGNINATQTELANELMNFQATSQALATQAAQTRSTSIPVAALTSTARTNVPTRVPTKAPTRAIPAPTQTPAVVSSNWYSQIQCFSENEVHPSPGETVNSETVRFSWPNRNILPEGYFYQVSMFGASDNYAALVARGNTRETFIDLQIPRERAGDIVWYVTLADVSKNPVDHGRCSFTSSLLTVNPPSGIKGIHFWYVP